MNQVILHQPPKHIPFLFFANPKSCSIETFLTLWPNARNILLYQSIIADVFGLISFHHWFFSPHRTSVWIEVLYDGVVRVVDCRFVLPLWSTDIVLEYPHTFFGSYLPPGVLSSPTSRALKKKAWALRRWILTPLSILDPVSKWSPLRSTHQTESYSPVGQ